MKLMTTLPALTAALLISSAPAPATTAHDTSRPSTPKACIEPNQGDGNACNVDKSLETALSMNRPARYPDSLAVVGHSQATGENTVPYENGDTKTNTWASGTNPAVRSIYLRILAAHPQIKGHVTNAAQGGATIADIEQQARDVAASHPDLLLVQAIDNDLTCPATPADVRAYGRGVASLLDTVASASPSTRVFIVSQYGSPLTYVQSLTIAERRDLAATMGPPGPCVFVDPNGNLVPKETRRLERIIVAYEHIQAKTCDRHRNCFHDHGAFSNAVERPGDYSDDLNHLSIQGEARAAALAWCALETDGLVPARERRCDEREPQHCAGRADQFA